MHKIKRKLLLSVFMLAVTIVTLTSTTFAWFARNQEAWTDEFEMDIETTEGLWISTDGINFSQDIGIEELKQAILNKTGVEYSSISYDGVSLKHNANQKIEIDSLGNVSFEKDSLEAISNSDYYNHILIDADTKDYIAFDLYLKVVTTGNTFPRYRLKLNENSYIKGNATTITLGNKLTTKDKEYQSGEVITVNPQDAMRLGISYIENDKYKMNVYEPNLGLGSSAVEEKEGDDYNKDLNAMFTYYNNTHPLSKFTSAATNGEGFSTLTDFAVGEYGYFEYSNTNENYNIIKVSVFVWLEGWDADYFIGVPSSKIQVKLGFVLEKEE